MSLPAKRRKFDLEEEQSVEGYIHSVSPIKTSKNNNRYFNAVVQESDKFTDLVSYKADLHEKMEDMEKKK